MTQKTVVATLFLTIFLFSFAAASFDSGWINFRDNNDYEVCGEGYGACSLNELGLDWYAANSGDNYDIICGEDKAPFGCLLWGGAGMGQTYNVPTSGDYYLFLKTRYGSNSGDNTETMIGGISSSWASSGRSIADLGTGHKSCVFRNSFSITNQNKVWLKGTGSSLNPYNFRLAECIPEESDLVYCDDGTPVTPTCQPQCIPTTEICGNGIDEDCDGSDQECPIIVDEPTITIQSPINGTTYATHLILINATADQVIDMWRYELNGGSVNPLFNGAAYTFSEGCHELTVYGENSNGVGTDTVNFCVNLSAPVDPDAPNVTIVNPENGETYNFTEISINATADQAIENWTFNVDGGIFMNFTPGDSYNFTEGCHDVIVLGENENGTGMDSVHFCIDLGGDDPEDPDDDDKYCDPKEDEEDVNPYALVGRVRDIVLDKDREAIVLWGADNNEESLRFGIYPVLIGLLLLGIIVVVILLLLLAGEESEKNKVVNYYDVEKGESLY